MGVLEGKVAVITGSTRGLGLAIAQAYARAGAAVMLAGRSEGDLARAVEDLRRWGAKASGQLTDVSDLAQVRALAEAAVRTFGRIDVWVNNAGLGGVYGPTLAIEPEQFEKVLRTNILGEYYGSLVALQHFRAQESGGKLITNLLRKIDVVEGYEKRLKAFSTIIRWWANPPAVPAKKAVWLASSATDGKTGLVVKLLSPRKLLGGVLNDLRRRIRREPAPDTSLDLTRVKSAL